MATPRKRWFRVADKLGAMAVSNDELATWIRLLGHLNTRWARDGLDPDQACVAVVKPGALIEWAGCASVARALRTLRALATREWLTLDAEGEYWRVTVPKFAFHQALPSDCREISGHSDTPELPLPLPRPASRVPRPSTDHPSGEPDGSRSSWLNVLSKEPGTEAEKGSFLNAEIQRIEDEAFAELPKDRANDKRALAALMRSKVLAWYRMRRANPGGPIGRAPNRFGPPPPAVSSITEADRHRVRSLPVP